MAMSRCPFPSWHLLGTSLPGVDRMPTHSGGQSWPQLSKSSRESCNKSKPPGIVTTASALQRRYLWGTVGRAGCHRGGAPAHLRDDLQRQPCQFRATEHPLSAPRCRGGIRPSAREVQGRQRGARNRNPPNVDRGKGTGQVANRRVPKYQDLRGASRSPSRGSSCNLVGKLRLALNQQQGPSFKMPMAKRNRALGVVGSVGQGSCDFALGRPLAPAL